jgi:hypothetical protein
MPRIEDRLLKAVTYHYDSAEAAERGEPGGSGFLVGEPTEIPEAVFLFAVTNAHVAKQFPVVRTAGPRETRLFVRRWEDWYRHPDQDDLAVTPIGFALKDARDSHVDCVPREWFVTPEHFSHASMDEDDPIPLGWPFGPGDEVVMLGRFLAHDGADENRPAARFGNLAMGVTVPIQHQWGFTQWSFLVECRSVSGYSGSPIFIFRPQTTFSAGLLPIGADPATHGKRGLPRLLGIDWGNLDRVGPNDYAVDWENADAAPTFPRRSGMAVAVPAWRLAELLDSEEVQDVKKKEEAEAKKAAAEGATLDFTPSEFDKFQTLAGKLVAVPKKELDEQRKKKS